LPQGLCAIFIEHTAWREPAIGTAPAERVSVCEWLLGRPLFIRVLKESVGGDESWAKAIAGKQQKQQHKERYRAEKGKPS